MAIIKCKDCEKLISSKAPACIHCGYQKKSITEQFKKGVYFLKVFFVLFILISFISFVNNMNSDKGREQIARSLNDSIDKDADVIKKMIIQRFE